MSVFPRKDLLGVKVEKLKFLVKSCGIDPNWTVQEAHEKVMELTKSTGLSLCHHLIHSQSPWAACVSSSTKFVSYSWSYTVKDVMRSILSSCKKEETVWIDLFSCSQNGLKSQDVSWFRHQLLEIVQDIGTVVLVLKPTTRPVTLTRLWCLFEVFTCLQSGGKLECAMPTKVWKRFLCAARQNIDAFQRVWTIVQSSRCRTSLARDKKKITEVLKAAGGFSVVDHVVTSAIKDWLVSLLTSEALKAEDDLEKAAYWNSLGSLHLRSWELELAEASFARAWETRKAVAGAEQRATLAAMYSLASVYVHQGKLWQAESMLEACLGLQQSALGEGDAHTLATMNALATVLGRRGEEARAEALLVECVGRKQERLGGGSASALTSKTNLAALYNRQGRYREAEALYKEVLRVRREAAGEADAGTLQSMHNLALFYRVQGRPGQAVGLMRRCWEGREAALGAEAAGTLESLQELALAHHALADFAAAESLLLLCARRRCHVLGPLHPDTRQTQDLLVAASFGRRCRPCAACALL